MLRTSIQQNKNIVNFLGFQILWWVCVTLGHLHAGLLVLGVVIAWLIFHLNLIESWADGLALIVLALIGATADQILYQMGLIAFPKTLGDQLIPIWMFCLWLAFATTLNVSMQWLSEKYWLSVLLGAIFGPVAYLAAEKLNAVLLLKNMQSLAAIALAWAILLPGLFYLRKVFLQRKPNRENLK